MAARCSRAAPASLVEIASGAVVNGGVALIGDGIVEIAGSSGESVKFLSNGSGGLKIADTVGPHQRLQRQGVRVRRFGALEPRRSSSTSCRSRPLRRDHLELRLRQAGNTSGTLFVSSGGTMVAAIKMVGSYSAGDFHITSGAGGTVAITDPTVPNGGSVEPGPGAPPSRGSGIDLPDIAFGAQTTLAYAENADRHRRHADGERRPPRRDHRAPRQLHGRKLRRRRRRPWRHAGHGSATKRAAAAVDASAARLVRVQINTIKKHGDKEAAPGGGSSGARVPRSRGAGAGASLRAR